MQIIGGEACSIMGSRAKNWGFESLGPTKVGGYVAIIRETG